MKATIISIFVAMILIGGAFLLTKGNSRENSITADNNVSIVDGKQIIEISAKGGYQPRKSVAKVGIPTVIRFNTAGTFDCSSSVRIPSLNISKVLPQSGSTDIDIGTGELGILRGSCGMGMYPFEIEFRS
jgi:plastocyanin domain-containing protein